MLDMSRPVTKFRKSETDFVFYQIMEVDGLYEEITEDLSKKRSLGDAMFLLKNTVQLRCPSIPVDLQKVEWDRLAKSLVPTV